MIYGGRGGGRRGVVREERDGAKEEGEEGRGGERGERGDARGLFTDVH